MNPIQHIWFDFSDTLVTPDKVAHDALRYGTYAKAVNKPVSPELADEYEALFKEHHSNTNVFRSLGLPADFWSEKVTADDAGLSYVLTETFIPHILEKLRAIVPISLWSTVRAKKLLPSLGIESSWFSHILGPDEVKTPKPALEGFELMIKRSQLPASRILYVGDSVPKEILPAKSLGIQTGLMWIESPEADYCFKSFKDIVAVVH